LLVTTDAVTDGYGTFLTADALTSGIGSYLSTSSTGLITNGRLLKVDATGDFDDAGGQVVEIASVHTTGTGLQLTMDAVTDGYGSFMTADALTSGIGLELESSSTALTTNGRLLKIDHTADFNDAGGYIAEISGVFTTGRGLNIVNNAIVDGFLTHINSSSTVIDATGRLFMIDHTGASTAAQGALAEIASAAADDTTIFKVTASAALAAGIAQDISVAALTTGTALDIGDLGAIISGKGINVASQNNTLTSGILVDIAAASTGLTTNGRLLKVAHSADFDDAGGYIAEISGAFTTGRGLNVVNNAITYGFLTHINSSATALASTGALLMVDHTGNATATGLGRIVRFQTAAADTTYLLDLLADSVTSGGVIVASADALTNGGMCVLTSSSTAITAGDLLRVGLQCSGSTLGAKTGGVVNITSHRTELAAAATADDYDVLSVIRTSITDTAGTLTAAGSVARLENVATQTAGTLTDNVDVLEIVQDAQSTGQSIQIAHNGAGNAVNMVLSAAAQAINIDADSTDHTAGNIIDVDLGVNSASVNVINSNIDIGTLLTTGEIVRGIYFDVNELVVNETGSQIIGAEFQMTAFDTAINDLIGLEVNFDGSKTTTADVWGVHVNADNLTVNDASATFAGVLVDASSATNTSSASFYGVDATIPTQVGVARTRAAGRFTDGTHTATLANGSMAISAGGINEELYYRCFDFDDGEDAAQLDAHQTDFNVQWTVGGTNHAAANQVLRVADNGGLELTTNGLANDSEVVTNISPIRINSDPKFEVRFKIASVTTNTAVVYMGLTETATPLANANFEAVTDDFIFVGVDTGEANPANVRLVTDDTGASAQTGTIEDLGVAASAGVYCTIRVDCTDTEQPRVWINNTGGAITPANEIAAGSITGTIQAGINMYPVIFVEDLAGANQVLTVDYFKIWQTR